MHFAETKYVARYGKLWRSFVKAACSNDPPDWCGPRDLKRNYTLVPCSPQNELPHLDVQHRDFRVETSLGGVSPRGGARARDAND
ncbi:hypothetical protein EVAR_98477_1 [Eumeta japonica]|uniref:Uncharacterized protein n=1 Tax=Eumeta variegata TaxID=151549 RepID=A0A4C1YHT8_EUMVA|nr:hypothetical protein EVAR_98477_1 [Eumeta japonica]